jgi:hypothetical protein
MINIDRSSLLPSIDSFQYYIPLTSTPKRSTKSYHPQPLSSTLSISNKSYKKLDLSISAISSTKKSSLCHKKRRRCYHRRRTHIHSSTIIKRIELKDLIYSTQAMKEQEHKKRYYTENELKIYIV